MDTAIETRDLGRRYGRNWALQDCTLTVPTGRVTALVGPNGAGKTTLLHLAVGLLAPSQGSIRVFGEEPRQSLRRVGFVAQDTPLYGDFTGAELIKVGGKLNPVWDAPAAHERLEQLRIPTDRKVGKLSGGQRAQVALTLALAKKPELLLLDEPVASLDPLARREFLQTLMEAVAAEGVTVLLSSHLLGDLENVCDHLIVLREAHVALNGSTEELLAEHRVMIGPRTTGVLGAEVIRASHTDRQSTLLVRGEPDVGPEWTVQDAPLEELILAYLAHHPSQAQGALT